MRDKAKSVHEPRVEFAGGAPGTEVLVGRPTRLRICRLRKARRRSHLRLHHREGRGNGPAECQRTPRRWCRLPKLDPSPTGVPR